MEKKEKMIGQPIVTGENTDKPTDNNNNKQPAFTAIITPLGLYVLRSEC